MHAFRWLFASLKISEVCYDNTMKVFWHYAEKADEHISGLEASERAYMCYLIGEGLGWPAWENTIAEPIIGSRESVEINGDMSKYKLHTKFKFKFGQMFSKGDKIEILDKSAELRGTKGEGKPLGRGFSTQIWNNGLENITDKDLENYINPLIKFIEKHPKQAKIEGLYKGNFQNWIRVR